MFSCLKHHLCRPQNRLRNKLICLAPRYSILHNAIGKCLNKHIHICRRASACAYYSTHKRLINLYYTSEGIEELINHVLLFKCKCIIIIAYTCHSLTDKCRSIRHRTYHPLICTKRFCYIFYSLIRCK